MADTLTHYQETQHFTEWSRCEKTVSIDNMNQFAFPFSHPSIAQLVERWTVVVWLSIGRWFESGSKDFFSPYKLALKIIIII